jgi:hypothetical protein
MTRLEERHRRVLRSLPAPYRKIWEEDMVATFLARVATDDPARMLRAIPVDRAGADTW